MTKPPDEQPRLQCTHCPWKVSTNPHNIPDGYCPKKHASLKDTIAEPGEIRLGGTLRVMACHESMIGRELPCVGWLTHQLGEGNNIALRMLAMTGRINANVETIGPQHERLEDTLP